MSEITYVEAPRADRLKATVHVTARDPGLAARLTAALGALRLPRAPRYPARWLEPRAIAELAPGALAGQVALVPVRRSRPLAARLAAVRAAAPLGIQLVFDDRRYPEPRRTRLRGAVFMALEEARGGPGCPLFVARTRRVTLALRLAIAARGGRS